MFFFIFKFFINILIILVIGSFTQISFLIGGYIREDGCRVELENYDKESAEVDMYDYCTGEYRKGHIHEEGAGEVEIDEFKTGKEIIVEIDNFKPRF